MKTFKKAFMVTIFAVLLSLLLTACASEPEDTANNDKAQDKGGSKGGDLVIATQSDAVSLDPQLSNDTSSANVRINIYDTLVTQDGNMELSLKPCRKLGTN